MRQYDNFEYDYPLVDEHPGENVKIIVVIPAFDEPELIKTVHSLFGADRLVEGRVEVLVVINESEDSTDELLRFHNRQFASLKKWAVENRNDSIVLYPVRASKLPKKYAGVGLARKIGMDEAAKRFIQIDYRQGIIASLDADVLISPNYFRALVSNYAADPVLRAANVSFEHMLNEDLPPEAIDAIIQYELHLRYFIGMQRNIGVPYAYHTIGSAMTVRVSAYLSHFGMNKRKAGEDFYFLHKFIKTGYFKEITGTVVFPSARFSDRVPFGTGRTVLKVSEGQNMLESYHPASFKALATLTNRLEDLYVDFDGNYAKLAEPVRYFFDAKLEKSYSEIKKHTDSYLAFKKRFYRWFDALQLLKYLHFCRDNYFANMPIDSAVDYLFKMEDQPENLSLKEKLLLLRGDS